MPHLITISFFYFLFLKSKLTSSTFFTMINIFVSTMVEFLSKFQKYYKLLKATFFRFQILTWFLKPLVKTRQQIKKFGSGNNVYEVFISLI